MIRNALDVNCLMARKDMIDGGEQIAWHTTPATESPATESEESDRGSYIYTDESRYLDCEMPELVVFLQESDYQAIKDLGTDGEHCGFDHDTVSCLLNFDMDSSELSKERQSTNSSIEQDDSRSLEKIIEVDSAASDEVSVEGYGQRTVPETQCQVEKADDNNCYHKLSKPSGHGGGQKFCQFQGPVEGAVLANSLLYHIPEEINSRRHAIEASFRSELEGGSNPLDIDSSIATVNRREKEPQVGDCPLHFEAKNLFRLDDGASESSRISTQILAAESGNGESSLSTLDPFSNSIAGSGRLAYCGSMSLRSNSSTRSFAFPILQSEWNGSPVKMTEPDRRHSRKCRPWLFHYLCCKF